LPVPPLASLSGAVPVSTASVALAATPAALAGTSRGPSSTAEHFTPQFGRELGEYALELYTEVKTVYVNLG
jgi:hypothetical protein